ncbi:MAG TPA: AAA family ATPase [Bacilli bacterium]|nr:AAA family ATPase [Bacilli bacterium]
MKITKGKIITVTSTKGGVGKTITTLNLTAMYHLLGYKVLVIDLDLYGGGVAAYINSTCEKTIYNLVDDLNNNRYQDINNYLYQYNENISVLAAPKDPRQANKIESKYLNIIFNTVSSRFDVILIDTNHILSENNIITLDNSDSILYMFTNDPLDIKNTTTFMSIVKDTNLKNFYTLLNESRDFEKNYFSHFDIRNIIKHNIDFTLSKSMYIKDIDSLIMDGKIILLNKEVHFKSKKDFDKLKDMAVTLLNESKEE